MKQAKLGIIFVVAIMALAAAGAGYAMWSQTLTITGTISTGEFIVGVRDDGTGDPGMYYPTGDLYPDDGISTRTLDYTDGPVGTWDLNYIEGGYAENDEGKNIARTESYNDGEVILDLHEGIQYYESIYEVVENAYPYYQSWITITFANIGTVPAKINSGDFVSGSGTDLFPWLVIDEVYFVEDYHEYESEVAQWYGSFTGDVLNGFQYQLDPCDTITLVMLFHFEETDGSDNLLPMDATMHFTYAIEWAQWNEVPQAVTPLGTATIAPGWYQAPNLGP